MPLPISPVPAERFCLTSGRVDRLGPFAMRVDAGGMRGVVPGAFGTTAELAFTYRGPSTTTAPLADGTVRRQIGLRLRAQDTCNAVYVMWHIEPGSGIAVSVKHNPQQSTHAECLARGYTLVRPTRATEREPVTVGVRRTLRADIEGRTLRISTDGAVTWEGLLPVEADAFSGPAGVRSDNGEFAFELRASGGVPGPSPCAGVVRD